MASIRFSPDGRRLLTGGVSDGRAIVWEARTGSRVRALDEPGGQPLRVDWSEDGSMVATAGSLDQERDGSVVIWRTADWSKVATLKADSQYSGAVDFSPDGATIGTAGFHGIARLWDIETTEPFGRPLVHPAFAPSLEFDRTGATLVTSSGDGNVRLWDAKSQRQLGPVLPGPGPETVPASRRTARASLWSMRPAWASSGTSSRKGGRHGRAPSPAAALRARSGLSSCQIVRMTPRARRDS